MRIGLVQPNFQSGPKHLNAYYLPYSVGILWSYAKQNERIKNSVSSVEWVFKRDPLSMTVSQLKHCDIVFFSIYVWNKNYCYELAKQLKLINPDVTIVIGGPEVPYTDQNFFNNHPYIDTIVIGEGEQAVSDIILSKLDNRAIQQIVNASRIKDLDFPSPYLDGSFDNLMSQHPNIEWMPTLETDRGCPYKCTFCDWGSLTASKISKFGLTRVFAELEWFADKKLPFLTMTNANFGIFKERDMLIAEKIVELSKTTGYPKGISVSYAKNSNADVFSIVEKFKEANIQTGFILSLQTTTESVLENIKRTNMDTNDISEIAEYGRQLQLPIYTEIIMGLPGETADTWKSNIENILNSNLHNGIDAFFLQLLENAPMMQDKSKYNIKTFPAYDMFYETTDVKDDTKVLEGIQVVESTNTMTNDELFESMLYTWFILGFHVYGISDIIAIYLNKNQKISYSEFYSKLIEYLYKKDVKISVWKNAVHTAFHKWKETGFFLVETEKITVLSWQLIHSLALFMHSSDTVDLYTNLVSNFVKDTYPKVDLDILHDYAIITKYRVKQWEMYHTSPLKFNTRTNLFEYTQGSAKDVVSKQHMYTAKDRYNHFPTSLGQHLDNIVYGRRRQWVLNIIEATDQNG
jgi:radical SAM superfamily enzyme YgiQ (UPF0313 family)